MHCAGPIRSAYENGAELPTGKSDRKAGRGLALTLDSSIRPHLVVKWQATAREPPITERRERLFKLGVLDCNAKTVANVAKVLSVLPFAARAQTFQAVPDPNFRVYFQAKETRVGPRHFGLTMVLIGVLALCFGFANITRKFTNCRKSSVPACHALRPERWHSLSPPRPRGSGLYAFSRASSKRKRR